MFIATSIGSKLGYKLTAMLSMFTFAGVTFLSSYIMNFWIFSLVYGVIPPTVLGIAYMIPLHCGWAYFPEDRGKVTGSISMAFGFATLPFNIIASWIVNPHNLSPTIEVQEGSQTFKYFTSTVADRAPLMLRWLAVIYFV